jgi:hypothetical protein
METMGIGSISFSPGFSPVFDAVADLLTVLTVSGSVILGKPLKRFRAFMDCTCTGLKPGENEMDF